MISARGWLELGHDVVEEKKRKTEHLRSTEGYCREFLYGNLSLQVHSNLIFLAGWLVGWNRNVQFVPPPQFQSPIALNRNFTLNRFLLLISEPSKQNRSPRPLFVPDIDTLIMLLFTIMRLKLVRACAPEL